MKRQREYIEGYRITRDGDGLLVEATDYHAMPLRLTGEDLFALGVRLVAVPEAWERPVRDGEEKKGREA